MSDPVETWHAAAYKSEGKAAATAAETERRAETDPWRIQRGVVLGNGSIPLPGVHILIRTEDGRSLERISDERGNFECDISFEWVPLVTVSFPLASGDGQVVRDCRAECLWGKGELRAHLSVEDGVIVASQDEHGAAVPAQLWVRIASHLPLSTATSLGRLEIRGSAFMGGFSKGQVLEVTALSDVHDHDLGEGVEHLGRALAMGHAQVKKSGPNEIPIVAIRLDLPLKRVRVRLAAEEEEGIVIGAVASYPTERNIAWCSAPELEWLRFRPDLESIGSYWVTVYPDMKEGLSVFTPLGGAFLTSDEVERLEDGDLIQLARDSFLIGYWEMAVGCPTSAESYIRVVLENGETIESCFISGGAYCVFVGDVAPRRLELFCGEAKAVIEQPTVGEIELVH